MPRLAGRRSSLDVERARRPRCRGEDPMLARPGPRQEFTTVCRSGVVRVARTPAAAPPVTLDARITQC